MRLTTVLLSAWLPLACANAPDGSWLEQAAPRAEGDALRVFVDPARSELVLEMQPVDVPLSTGDHAGHHGGGPQPPTQYGVVPVSAWVHGYTVELVDGAGRVLPRELLHHVNIIAPDRRELFSPIMQRVGAAGQETAPVAIPKLLGYPLERGDRILLGGAVHNPTSRAYQDVRIRVRMPLTSRERRIRPVRVYPFYLDVMPPASVHRFDLPPGRSEHSWEGRPAVSGRILGMGGHLHEHAVALRLEDVTAREVLWETHPVTDRDGNLIGMPQAALWWRLGLRIRSDHTYRLTAVYDNPTGATIPQGGMGALGGIFVPASDVVWPRVDLSDPDYLLDVKLTEAGADAGALMLADPPGTEGAPAAGGAHEHPAKASPHAH